MADIPIYWVGITIWIAGFYLYLYPEDLPSVRRIGSGFCWIGLIVTAVSWFVRDGALELPTSADFYTVIGIAGVLLIIASWVGWLRHRVGWIGFCIAMGAVVTSWFDDPQHKLYVLGATLVSIALSLALWFALPGLHGE